ncbi:Flp family type IVb pilin [Brevundimonas sp.]|uniref:Flp family type IVb pilin n=1 Tax=Brevundimonas sp. TaxID=1871086 RepID=UPI002FC6BDD9
MRTTVKAFASDTRGATAIEYGLIASLIAMVILVALSATGDGVMAKWDLVMKRVSAALSGNGGEGGEGGEGG